MRETVKVTFSLKCFEKNNFVCKRNQSSTQDCKRDTTYDELHNIARLHYKIPISKSTQAA